MIFDKNKPTEEMSIIKVAMDNPNTEYGAGFVAALYSFQKEVDSSGIEAALDKVAAYKPILSNDDFDIGFNEAIKKILNN